MDEEIKRAIEELGRAVEEFKKTNDQRLAALEAGKSGEAAELGQKLEKLNAEIGRLSEEKSRLEAEQRLQKERIEELEMRAKAPGRASVDKVKQEHSDLFVRFLRSKGQDAFIGQKLREIEAKAVTTGTPADGGYAVPEELAREIERQELLFSPVRQLVRVVQVGTPEYRQLVNVRGATAGWVGESDSRTETATPVLRERRPTHGELYAYVQASDWALNDIFFDVQSWLAEEAAEAFAVAEGEAVISGNGTNKPTGMLNTAPVATPDFASPARDAAAYEAIECKSMSSPAVPEIHADCLIELVYKLNAAYRVGASWVMNSMTIAEVRKLKDANGQYLWQPSLQVGQPETLLGYPLYAWEQMPDIEANSYPIGFGNWRRAYLMIDIVGLRLTVDQVTRPGFVKFYIRRRLGGTVLNNNAAKFLKTVTT